MQTLPISKYKNEILYAVDTNEVVLVTAETGSGKTTQIPQFLVQAGYTIGDKKIAVVLPRKIAAITLAKRVADQLGCCNGEIAHKVRFNSTANGNTRVLFLTDGAMVQELYSDPILKAYSIIVLDDVHQRSVSCDILFSFVRKILGIRNDLKVVITSASLDSKCLQLFFEKQQRSYSKDNLRVANLNITGRLHAVRIHYLRNASKNYFLKIFQTIVYIDRQRGNGDILVFLTSVEEIDGMTHMIDSYALENKRSIKVLKLHSKLSSEQQGMIFEHCHERRIILSTNISQSSITIPDVGFVVDSGYVKVKVFDVQAGVEKLIVVPCGKSSANQRAGRAGRVKDGECFRVYHRKGYDSMPEKVPPEILRVDLVNVLLKLKGLGIRDIMGFDFIERPRDANLARAIDMLYAYGLVDAEFELTALGTKVAELSIDFRNGCMLMNSFQAKFGCSRQILMLVSMLQVQRELFANNGLAVLKAKKKIGAKQGDFLTLVNMFIRYQHAKPTDRRRICGQYKLRYATMQQAIKIHDELLAQIKRLKRFTSELQRMQQQFDSQAITIPNYELQSSKDQHQAILRCILTGYFTNVAQLTGDGSYLNIRSKQRLKVHATSVISVVYPEWIVYLEIIRSHCYYIHNASQIYPDWLFELAGHFYTDNRKQIAETGYKKDQATVRTETLRTVEPKKLLQVGGFKQKQEIFNTSVLGLKQMRKNKLFFEEQL